MAQLVNLSVEEPVNVENGYIWVRLNLGQAVQYYNGDWLPFCGGEVVDFHYPLTVFLKGQDITDHYYIKTFRKIDAITNQVDTLNFTMIDTTGTSKPIEGEEVIVFKKATSSSTPVKWFSGEVCNVAPVEFASGLRKFEYSISCIDFKKRFGKNMAVETYASKTDIEIIADLIDKYGHEFTYYNIKASGLTIDKISFNYENLNRCIERICERTGFDWYIDDEKDLHYFDKADSYAPYQLTEDDSTGHYRKLQFKGDPSQLRNRIIVRGGVCLSGIYTDTKVAQAGQTGIKLDYKPHNPVSIKIDTVTKTLGVDNMSTTSDFVVNYQESLIKPMVYNGGVMVGGEVVETKYKYEIQVLTEDRDNNSIQERMAVEGGDGIHSYLISDPSVETIDQAHSVALADLLQNSDVKIEGGFDTEQETYRSGQTIVVNLPTWGYQAEYLITQVTATMRGDNCFDYHVVFSTKKKDLINFLVNINDKLKPFVTNFTDESQETLHDLDKEEVEEVALTEGTPSFKDEDTPPYVYGGGTGSPVGVYNKSQYG